MLADYVEQALKRAGLRPSRGRGQHFLIDDAVLAEAIAAARLDGSEWVIEIGPGLGQLTHALSPRCKRLTAYELDDKLARYLNAWVLPELDNVELQDVAFNKYVFEPVLAQAQAAGCPVKFVTNLPYQISSQFLHTVVEYAGSLSLVVVMLQREVAQRVTAKAGGPGYGSLSLYMQTFLAAQWVCDVPRSAFFPEPRVDSAVITLKPLAAAEQPQPRDRELYLKLIEGVFRHRRKRIANSLILAMPHLGSENIANALSAAGTDAGARPQELTMADYVKLADALVRT
jgi:16S rRNA (adenine1518-N6/adenine1519-N6)-dimethyltransferase